MTEPKERYQRKTDARVEMQRMIAAYGLDEEFLSIRIQSVEHQTVTLPLDDLLSLSGSVCRICGKGLEDRESHLCPEPDRGE